MEEPRSSIVQAPPTLLDSACPRETSASQLSGSSHLLQAADRQPVALGAELDDPLRVVPVAVLEERGALALGRHHGLELERGRRCGPEGVRHGATLLH